jgi:hypothetical protein
MVQNPAFQDPPLEKLDNRTDTTLEWTHYVFFDKICELLRRDSSGNIN